MIAQINQSTWKSIYQAEHVSKKFLEKEIPLLKQTWKNTKYSKWKTIFKQMVLFKKINCPISQKTF